MEVWALEAYGAAHILQELLTAKSGRRDRPREDLRGDRQGRRVASRPGLPESFNVLIRELQSLCLDVELMKTKQQAAAATAPAAEHRTGSGRRC